MGKKLFKQAQQLVDAGYKEIVLTGIHTGGYGEDIKDYNLAGLLRDMEAEVDGLKTSFVFLLLKRVRFR